MARSVKAFGVACMFAAVRGSTDDTAALVQTQVRSHVTEQGALLNDVLNDLYSGAAAAMAEAEQKQAAGAVVPLEMNEKPKPPIWHGVLFEREVVDQEAGTQGLLTFDHGCAKKDEFGDNFCEFPHGDTIHMKYEYKLAKPIESGYFAFTGTPKLMGIGGFLKNGIDGKKQVLTAKMDDISVECPICGGTCELTLLGKQRTVELPACPLPANKTITMIDMDMDLPYGQLLPLIQMRMQGSFVIYRQDGEESHLVANSKMLFQMGRIYKGMPTMM